MKRLPDERQIYITSRLWHEIHPKIDVAPFMFALHEGIDLSKYGHALEKFYFTFLVLRPPNRFFPPGTYYSRKKKSIEVAVAIDYEKAFNATRPEVIKMMEQAYLEGIDLIATRVKRDFDVAAFRKDVEALFSKDKWYELMIEPSH